MTARIHVNVAEVPGVADADPAALRRLLTRAVRETLADRGRTAGEISVTLLSDSAIAELNRRYLDRDGPTDVIAFPLNEPDSPPLGDVYIGWDRARAQAERLGLPMEEELVRLAVHGALHVLGHDHPEGSDRQASEMWSIQEEIVRRVAERGAR